MHSHMAILFSLPQPIADEVVELGTVEAGPFSWMPGDYYYNNMFPEPRVIDHDGISTRLSYNALGARHETHVFSEVKVRRVPATDKGLVDFAKRPPCDACGEEVRGRSPSELVVSSLPTYDQIAGWLGAEWSAMCHEFRWEMDRAVGQNPLVKHPRPWIEDVDCVYRCYLKHTPSNQRVEVTAPREPPGGSGWCIWFGLIRNRSRMTGARSEEYQRYQQHVRWLDPDTKTSGSRDAATRKSADSAPSGSEVFASPQPAVSPEPRWTTADPARIAALEAKLAEQVASGGQDGKSARWLVERADDLRREEEARKLPLTSGDAEGRREAWGVDPFVQAGPRLMRHELSSDQSLNRTRTGR